MATVEPSILRPKPRRPFDDDAVPQQPPSPFLAPSDAPNRNPSILNLTSSTLLGIYSPTGYESDRDLPSTPWGTGLDSMPSSQDPASRSRRRSIVTPPMGASPAGSVSLILRSLLLFALGTLYGLLVRHLHDDRQLAPFQVEGIIKPSKDWRYLMFWGVAGVGLGSLLPWVDMWWSKGSGEICGKDARAGSVTPEKEGQDADVMAAWTPVVRSVGAFVGIAFAIRRLPWTSTLQASLTLALVNPVLWYIIDRSKPGFLLSSAVGATGTAILLASNSDMMPGPATGARNSTMKHRTPDDQVFRGPSRGIETVEGGIWILSVLFCSCVCFGNIGRRLALSGGGERIVVGSRTQRRLAKPPEAWS